MFLESQRKQVCDQMLPLAATIPVSNTVHCTSNRGVTVIINFFQCNSYCLFLFDHHYHHYARQILMIIIIRIFEGLYHFLDHFMTLHGFGSYTHFKRTYIWTGSKWISLKPSCWENRVFYSCVSVFYVLILNNNKHHHWFVFDAMYIVASPASPAFYFTAKLTNLRKLLVTNNSKRDIGRYLGIVRFWKIPFGGKELLGSSLSSSQGSSLICFLCKLNYP